LRTGSELANAAVPFGSAVKLEAVSVRYRLPRERILSFKEYALHWIRGRVRYQDVWALRGATFEAERGETLGIVGANGAGKSTLLKCVAGVLQPTEGRVRVWGRVVPLIELGAGFELELTGRENTFLNGAVLGFSGTEVRERLDDIVEFAELGDFIDAPLRTYSSGMVARLAFAVATHSKPEVLIIDEVLAVGDATFQKRSFERIVSFRESGTTILLVSHDLTAVATLCHRVVWLDHGCVRKVGPAPEVLADYRKSMS
jgi:ABC-2 type transport system ATP-binding protein